MRPWQIWLSFVACSAVVVAAVGWLSLRAIDADDAQAAALRQAALEENARLALWRMDSAIAPLVAQESARPYFAYEPFYSVERAYGQNFGGKKPSDAQLPSPLLTELPPQVLLPFQIDEAGRFSSPRVPAAAQQAQVVPQFLTADDLHKAQQSLDRLRKAVDRPTLLTQLPPPVAPPEATNEVVALPQLGNGGLPNLPTQAELGHSLPAAQPAPPNPPGTGNGTQPTLPNPAPNAPPSQQPLPQSSNSQQPYQQAAQGQPQQGEFAELQQQVRGNSEFQARAQILNNSANYYGNNGIAQQGINPLKPGAENPLGLAVAADVRAAVMKPLWLGDQLVLARRVQTGGHELIQGCLLDWPAIRQQLLAAIGDLLPSAKLAPVAVAEPGQEAHLLASLPVRLELGSLPETIAGGLSPVRLALIVAWALMLLAALAVAALLQGVLSLSERRGAFVSAVTHELRTPLTTFRMYAEMLAENMVPDEQTRHGYLETLRIEADRLTHLVENVLSYARLERSRPARRIGSVSVAEVLGDSAMGRLTDRARQADLTLSVEADETIRQSRAQADPAAVEQILFNLVDNACKYAATATDRTLHLSAEPSGSRILLRLRDHGPGISADQRRAIFRPFRKSAREAAHTAPGVGLGLALCRRLARDMGGELSYESPPAGGACFTLRLRAA